MFTGIIESMGTVKNLVWEGDNLHVTVSCDFTDELKIDQSVAHNGVCLTIVHIKDDEYTVTAIKETIDKTNFKSVKVGSKINLERAMILGARLDGHIVQGHVDQTAICTGVKEANGSWFFSFKFEEGPENITIEKGSVTVNGTSLTVVNSIGNTFEVAIIPYTHEHTNFHTFKEGTEVNLEFDVIGKYVARLMEKRGE
ncbi:MAG: riboflavin synthase [Flavobacteriaceae bacterium]|nr:MAG: riboflavin synthase [Flavobacteriaceae bacterium]